MQWRADGQDLGVNWTYLKLKVSLVLYPNNTKGLGAGLEVWRFGGLEVWRFGTQ